MTAEHEQDALALVTEVPFAAVPVEEAPVLPIPKEWGLPPHGTINVCPKCGHDGDGVTVAYHEMLYLGAPCGTRYGVEAQVNHWEFPEHLCKVCPRCDYGWAEAVSFGDVR